MACSRTGRPFSISGREPSSVFVPERPVSSQSAPKSKLAGRKNIHTQTLYRGQLRQNVQCDADLQRVKNLPFRQDELVKYFLDYNDCTGAQPWLTQRPVPVERFKFIGTGRYIHLSSNHAVFLNVAGVSFAPSSSTVDFTLTETSPQHTYETTANFGVVGKAGVRLIDSYSLEVRYDM